MKIRLFTFLCVCVTTFSYSQINELGFFVGGSNYVGDIGRTNYFFPNKPAGGVIYKWNWNPRIALRGTFSHLPIESQDVNSDNPRRRQRGFQFANSINELAVGIEFNFFEYDLSSDDKTYTPYILLELAGFSYKAAQSEIVPGLYNYNTEFSTAIPFGVGFKARLMGKIAFAVETRVRYVFSDGLDYSTERVAALNFGKDSNDWYMFTGFSLVYTFGRPSCYADRR